MANKSGTEFPEVEGRRNGYAVFGILVTNCKMSSFTERMHAAPENLDHCADNFF